MADKPETTSISDAFYELVHFIGTQYPEAWKEFCKKHHAEIASKTYPRKMIKGDLYAGI